MIAQVAYLLLDLAETDTNGQPVAHLSHTTIGLHDVMGRDPLP